MKTDSTLKRISDHRIQFHRIIMRLATDFVNAPLENLDKHVQEMLHTVGQFIGADRVYVFDYDFSSGLGFNVYEWCAEGIAPEMENLQNIPMEHFSLWLNTHLAGEILFIPQVLNLPVGDPTRDILEPQGIQSLVTLPIFEQGRCTGFIGFDAVKQERHWNEDEIALLRVLAELLSNIRDRKRTQEALVALNASLEQRIMERTTELQLLYEELEAFSYSVSHDLKAPLRHIKSFLTVIRRKVQPVMDDDLNRYMQFVETAAKSMKATIDDLLEFSKIGKQPLRKRNTDMTAIVEEVIRELEPEQTGREIEWTIDLPREGVLADPGMMKIIWVNLLSNALKYTRTRVPARIAAGARREEDDTVFFVRDNGVGFDMTHYDRLFAAFQRLHTDEAFEGSGIGLATVKRIVLKHGGRIWAESKPDEGAGFYF